jgi:predicted nucleic acid-binding protein
MLFAYWFEGNATFDKRVRSIYEAVVARGDTLCASAFTLAELLVRPVKFGDTKATQAVEEFFRSDMIEMLELTPTAPCLFAELRAFHQLKPMDAFHLSLAAAAEVDVFLTNDRRLHHIKQPGLPLIASLETDIF